MQEFIKIFFRPHDRGIICFCPGIKVYVPIFEGTARGVPYAKAAAHISASGQVPQAGERAEHVSLPNCTMR